MTHVTDEILGKIARQEHDLFRRVREGTLDPEKVSRGLQDLIEGKTDQAVFQHDMTKEAWELVEDVEGTQYPHQLELAPFLLKGESYIKGEELVERAKKMQANLGQRQAEYLLDHQDKIPEEWRQYYLVFPGTTWRGRGGFRSVPYLRWDGERWCLGFAWLGSVFDSGDRLLRPRE